MHFYDVAQLELRSVIILMSDAVCGAVGTGRLPVWISHLSSREGKAPCAHVSRPKAGAEFVLLQPTVFTCWVNRLLPTPHSPVSEQQPDDFCAQTSVWQALVTASCSWDQTDLGRVEAVVKMVKGRAETVPTHIGAFSLGQSDFSGPSGAQIVNSLDYNGEWGSGADHCPVWHLLTPRQNRPVSLQPPHRTHQWSMKHRSFIFASTWVLGLCAPFLAEREVPWPPNFWLLRKTHTGNRYFYSLVLFCTWLVRYLFGSDMLVIEEIND